MAAMEFRDGKYILKGAGAGRMLNVRLAPVVGAILLAGIIFAVNGGTDGKNGGDEFLTEKGVFLVPFILILLVSTILPFLFSKLQNRIVIDPAAGMVSFTRTTSGRGSATVRVPFISIREIALSARNGAYSGRPGMKHFIIRLVTSDGEEDLVTLPDEANARQLAQELSGILSRSLKDLT